MHTVTARNVNDAYRQGILLVSLHGEKLPSRNGPVLRVPGLVVTEYKHPQERVLFDAQRNANPFFHLFEALWMLNGQNDVYTMDQFLASFKEFSDDGVTFHGAYGHRWRHHFGGFRTKGSGSEAYDHWEELDQIATVIEMLRTNRNDRRCVIAMWDPKSDLKTASKDVPCNDLVKVSIVENRLDIQVYNRSNDIVFGCYGANAVHMAFLQEYIAAKVGVLIGRYYQISGDYHAYLEEPYKWERYFPLQDVRAPFVNPYDRMPSVAVHPLVTNSQSFDTELHIVMRHVGLRTFHQFDSKDFENTFFGTVVRPMYAAHRAVKNGELTHAIRVLQNANNTLEIDNDWITAGFEWVHRLQSRRA